MISCFWQRQPWQPNNEFNNLITESRSADRTYPDNPPIQQEAFLLRRKNLTIFLPLHLRLKRRFMQIRIEHVPSLSGIEPLQPMLFQRLHQYGVRHFEPLVQIHQLLVAVWLADLLSRDGTKSAIKVVNTFDEITREAGDGESSCRVDVAFCAILKIAEVCYRAEIPILEWRWNER